MAFSNKKRFDREELLAFLKQDGENQVTAAKHFGVSKAAISKALKRLERDASPPPESFEKLPPGKKRFVLAKIDGKSNTGAAVDAFNCSTTESAHTIGQELSKDPDINAAIHDLMYEEGIGRRYRVKRLRTLINSRDLGIVHKGLELAAKQTGDFAPDKLAVLHQFQTGTLSAEVEELIEQITSRIRPIEDKPRDALKQSGNPALLSDGKTTNWSLPCPSPEKLTQGQPGAEVRQDAARSASIEAGPVVDVNLPPGVLRERTFDEDLALKNYHRESVEAEQRKPYDPFGSL